MKGFRDSHFLRRWHQIYTASNPGLTSDAWQVDGVDWRRHRYSNWTAGYSFQIEVHTLSHTPGARNQWSVLVVIEHWWGPDRSHDPRTVEWFRLLSGRAESVQSWLRERVPD